MCAGSARLSLAVLACLVTCGGGTEDRYHPRSTEAGPGRADVDPAELGAAYWREEADSAIQERLRAAGVRGVARNVVMFMGDGMSVATLTAARTLLGQLQNRTGEEAHLTFETFPTVGLAKTYCVNAQVPDSACTATAYLCGAKTNQGMLGLTAAVARSDCDAQMDTSTHLESIASWALADGRDAGIVTTTRVTHASPGGAFARAANRNWETDADVRADGADPARCPDIALQLVHHEPGRLFKVVLGGGRQEFRPVGTADEEGGGARRGDGRDLIQEWQQDKEQRGVSHRYVWNRTELLDLMSDPPEYLLGLFESDHMRYHLEGDPTTEPTLAELTETAIRSLSRNERGFFLFVEGGRIDHAHHDNYPQLALDETIEMSEAVRRATELLDEQDSLVVVTADHTHVMTFNGYSSRGTDVLGPVSNQRDSAGVPYMTLSYTNGPGFRAHAADGRRADVTQDTEYRALRWRTHVDAPLASETHGGDEVPVFARGPHHHMFTGLYEQSQLPHLVAYAACLGPRVQACAAADDATPAAAAAALPAPASLAMVLVLLALAQSTV